MSFTLGSLSSEISLSCCENISRNKNLNSFLPSAFNRIGDLNQNGNFQIRMGVLKKAVVSSHLIPGRVEESYLAKKRLPEPSSKLDLRTLLIDNYDSYTYNIFQELSIINGCKLYLIFVCYAVFGMCLVVL